MKIRRPYDKQLDAPCQTCGFSVIHDQVNCHLYAKPKGQPVDCAGAFDVWRERFYAEHCETPTSFESWQAARSVKPASLTLQEFIGITHEKALDAALEKMTGYTLTALIAAYEALTAAGVFINSPKRESDDGELIYALEGALKYLKKLPLEEINSGSCRDFDFMERTLKKAKEIKYGEGGK